MHKLIAALGELNAWVLVYERLVQLAEVSVFALHEPVGGGLSHVQAHLYLVLCVCSVVLGVLDEEGVADLAV